VALNDGVKSTLIKHNYPLGRTQIADRIVLNSHDSLGIARLAGGLLAIAYQGSCFLNGQGARRKQQAEENAL
jgi:hypothetical protein